MRTSKTAQSARTHEQRMIANRRAAAAPKPKTKRAISTAAAPPLGARTAALSDRKRTYTKTFVARKTMVTKVRTISSSSSSSFSFSLFALKLNRRLW